MLTDKFGDLPHQVLVSLWKPHPQEPTVRIAVFDRVIEAKMSSIQRKIVPHRIDSQKFSHLGIIKAMVKNGEAKPL